MLEFSVLASSSKANCVYIGSPKCRVLVDCGLSARETARRLVSVGVNPDTISAVFVTHEHSDHIAGIPIFCDRHDVLVFANEDTIAEWGIVKKKPELNIEMFYTGQSFNFEDLLIEPFSIMHDAADPVGLRISCGDEHIAVVTDIGQVTNLVRESIRNVDALILESNHDLELLKEAPYPWDLKQRIAGSRGHLSNCSASALVDELDASDPTGRLGFLIAAHISEKANCPELVFESLSSVPFRSRPPQIVLANPYTPTELFGLSLERRLYGCK